MWWLHINASQGNLKREGWWRCLGWESTWKVLDSTWGFSRNNFESELNSTTTGANADGTETSYRIATQVVPLPRAQLCEAGFIAGGPLVQLNKSVWELQQLLATHYCVVEQRSKTLWPSAQDIIFVDADNYSSFYTVVDQLLSQYSEAHHFVIFTSISGITTPLSLLGLTQPFIDRRERQRLEAVHTDCKCRLQILDALEELRSCLPVAQYGGAVDLHTARAVQLLTSRLKSNCEHSRPLPATATSTSAPNSHC
eukprot:Lankesteria_metandrocarpae@DN9313_c0_g1_i1.p1